MLSDLLLLSNKKRNNGSTQTCFASNGSVVSLIRDALYASTNVN